MSEPLYLHDWADDGQDGMLSDFGAEKAALEGARVIVADYTYENYSGSAYVLFERDGKLWEIHGSHCSCYGLEGQWEPEEADEAEVRHRFTYGVWQNEKQVAEAVLAALNARRPQ